MKPVFLSHIAFTVVAVFLTGNFTGKASGQEDTRKQWRSFYDANRDALRRGAISEQLFILETFAEQDYPEASEFLFDWIRKTNTSSPATARKAAEVLGSHKNGKALQLVSDPVRKNPAGNLNLLRAFFVQNPPDVSAVALEVMKTSSDPGIRAAAIPVAAQMKLVDPVLLRGLIYFTKEDQPAALRRASAEALGRINSEDGIPTLIEMLADPLLEEISRDALLRLTGEDHWTDAEAWNNWWREVGSEDSYHPNPLSEKEFVKMRDELARAKDDPTGELAAVFYGRKIKGKSILFLLDASKSMENDGRIERLKQEFKTMFLELSPKRRFALILFPHDVFPSGPLVLATEENKSRATQFTKLIRPDGQTPMMAAFKYAFEELVVEENVDTIYLLSDGEPTDYPAHRVRENVLEYNGSLAVQIHTIWLGGNGKQLLEFIARESGGNFWEADQSP